MSLGKNPSMVAFIRSLRSSGPCVNKRE